MSKHEGLRAETLAWLGRHAEAAAALRTRTPVADYASGPVVSWSLCARAAERDETLDDAARRALAATYVEEGLAALRRGIETGFRNSGKLRGEKLAPLRAHPEFAELERRIAE